MIEKIKAINNPLTIIAIFAGLAELAGTVAIRLVTPELQYIFIWFVMGLPVMLVVLFFMTLNFNPKVLYAPSDFQNEENFLLLTNGVTSLSSNLGEVQQQLEVIKTEIVEEAKRTIGEANKKEFQRLLESFESKISSVQVKIESARESVEDVALQVSPEPRFDRPRLKAEMRLEILSQFKEGEVKTRLAVTQAVRQSLQARGYRISLASIYQEFTQLGNEHVLEEVDNIKGKPAFRRNSAV
jgi:hypothetical protein